MRRKGELSPAALDRKFPHQVALRDDAEGRTRYLRAGDIVGFCGTLTLAPRGHYVSDGVYWYRVYCFADAAHAAAFLAEFGGELFDPRERGRGDAWMTWHRGMGARRRG